MNRIGRIVIMAAAPILGCCAAEVGRAAAPPPTKEGLEFFENKIRPVLVKSCYECHSSEHKKIKGKLRLDDYAAMLKGGESGKPSVVPGDPEKSQIVFSMTYKDVDSDNHDALLMPPPKNGKPKKLPDSVINDFREWIKMGAPYPEATGAKSQATPVQSQKHWAFVPPTEPVIPEVKQPGWVKNTIDRFVMAKLEAQNLHPSNPADKRTLIRRATLDLTGLPPTEQEVEAFEADASSNAFEKVVDRLLASPRYGERWGRYWLDVARYSDTKGYVFEEERRYPYSYTYRDWVIRAFNDDLPYDQFLIQQIAADKLDLKGDNRPLAAEGFLTLGRRFLNNAPDIMDDRIDVVCRGTMALTVQCARCHDHKFDPILQKDYYSLYAVFNNSPEAKNPPELAAPGETAAYQKFQQELAKRQAAMDAFIATKLHEVTESFRDPDHLADYLIAAQFGKSPDDPGYPNPRKTYPQIVGRWKGYLARQAAAHDPVFSAWRAYAAIPAADFAEKSKAVTENLAAHPAEPLNPLVAKAFEGMPPASIKEVAGRYAKLLNQFSSDGVRKDAAEEQLRLVLHSPDTPARIDPAQLSHFLMLDAHHEWVRLRSAIDSLKVNDPGAPPRPMCLEDAKDTSEQHVFLRGNPSNPGDVVKPHFITFLTGGSPTQFTDGSGRLELARDIASKDNPLTARVMVNRIWLHHFGQGLVRTPSDFGMRSDPPTHPQLLDWLALRFVENGWSVKAMQKLIMLSATYQQSSEYDPVVAKADPENLLLSHFNRQRLDWEATRDSLLASAGHLDLAMGGKPVEILESSRRTVYGFIDRQNLSGVFRAFDFASPDATSPQRFTTTVPQQALFLMNSPFAVQQAESVVQRPEVAGESDPAGRVSQLYKIIYQRSPRPQEIALGLQFVGSEQGVDHPASPWRYGYGEFDEASGRTKTFTALAHFTGQTWQGGAQIPDKNLAFLSLNASGGHPGRDVQHAAIRRWVSPIDGVIQISGTVAHEEKQGDGIRARIISSRSGELASWNVFHMKAATNIENIEVKKGDAIDFLVDCKANDGFDSFGWAPVIKAADPAIAGNDGPARWSAADGFSGPVAAHLDSWVKYAQVLLESNEFVFVD